MKWVKADSLDDKVVRYRELTKKLNTTDSVMSDEEMDERQELEDTLLSDISSAILETVKKEMEAEIDNITENLYDAVPRKSSEPIVKDIAQTILGGLADGHYKDVEMAINAMDTDFLDDILEEIKKYLPESIRE